MYGTPWPLGVVVDPSASAAYDAAHAAIVAHHLALAQVSLSGHTRRACGSSQRFVLISLVRCHLVYYLRTSSASPQIHRLFTFFSAPASRNPATPLFVASRDRTSCEPSFAPSRAPRPPSSAAATASACAATGARSATVRRRRSAA